MKKVKWYSLPPLPTLLLVGAAAALLTCTLRADEHNALAYFSYLLSTYALITGMSGLVRLFRAAGTMLRKSRLMRKLHENAHLARYLDDALSGRRSTCILARRSMPCISSSSSSQALRSAPDDSSRFQHTMLGVSGLVASLILLSMSVYMIVHASRKLKQMGENKNE